MRRVIRIDRLDGELTIEAGPEGVTLRFESDAGPPRVGVAVTLDGASARRLGGMLLDAARGHEGRGDAETR
jgi:hypothetical protein